MRDQVSSSSSQILSLSKSSTRLISALPQIQKQIGTTTKDSPLFLNWQIIQPQHKFCTTLAELVVYLQLNC